MSGAPKLNLIQAHHVDVAQLASTVVEPHWVGLSDSLPPEDVLRLATEVGFGHVCQKTGHQYDKELRSANQLVQSPEAFLEFPVASILTPDDLTQVSERALMEVEAQFDSSAQKRDVLEQITKALESKGLPQTLSEDVIAVADEFFTNAVYNAPFIDPDTHKNPVVSRQDFEIKLKAGKSGRLFLAHDESRLVIGCQDPFGSLDLKSSLNKIKATYLRGAAATMNFGSGGAGLGSYIIFNTGSSLYFGVWPKRATVLCCVLPLGMSNRKRAQLPKHLHWIQR